LISSAIKSDMRAAFHKFIFTVFIKFLLQARLSGENKLNWCVSFSFKILWWFFIAVVLVKW